MVARSQSLPPGQVNPFWSTRVQSEVHLRAARPEDLPVPLDPEMDGASESVESKGRGRAPSRRRQSRGREVVGGTEEVDRRIFRTPASWISQRELMDGEAGRAEGLRTAGVMPAETPVGAQPTEGPAPGVGLVQDELERDLEREVVRQLHEENMALKQRLQEMEDKEKTVGSEWSEVTALGSPRPPPPPSSDKMRPAMNQEEDWEMIRWTPGGTRVPAGPPPPEMEAQVPVWPFELYERIEREEAMKWLGQPTPPVGKLRRAAPGGGMDSRGCHEVCDGGTGSRHGDREGGRNSRMDAGSMTAMEARTLWLEREMGMLKQAMERETSRQKKLQADYWRQEVQRDDQPLSRAQGLPEGDRAVRQQGLPEGDRAFRHHGLPEGDRASRHPGLPEGDRASRHPGLPEGDRAFRQSGLHEGDRAFGQQGVPEGDRVREKQAEGEKVDQVGLFDPWPTENTGPKEEEVRKMDHGSWKEGQAPRRMGLDYEDGKDNMKSVAVTLPVLPAASGKESGLVCGDWLVQVRPLLGDMAPEALEWWDEIMRQVLNTYGRWLEAGPIERLHIAPPSDEACSSTPLRRRMTLRASTLLMNAMPPGLREELVASRTLSTSGILFKVLRNYQPGGAAEKTETLQALTVAKSAKTPRDAVEQLRKWRRHQLRADELGVVLPDCSILIKALTAMVQDVLAGAPQASFRVNSFRMQCHLDTKPSPTNMESYYQMVLAEMENLVLAPENVAMGGGSSTSTTTTPTVKMVQGAGKGGTKSDTGLQLCRSWGSENGCRFGKSCKFAHPALPDSRERCWNCSSTTHQKSACPYNKQSSPGNPMSASGGSERGDRDGGAGRGGREGRGGKTNNKGGKGSKGDQVPQQDDGKGKGDGSSEDKRAASMSTAKKEEESARDLESRGSEQPTTGSTGEQGRQQQLRVSRRC